MESAHDGSFAQAADELRVTRGALHRGHFPLYPVTGCGRGRSEASLDLRRVQENRIDPIVVLQPLSGWKWRPKHAPFSRFAVKQS